ncbi:MAG: glycogen synthase GlgA [Acetomicrobium sp.]
MSLSFSKIKVLHVASEMHPIVKKGGLGDVIGSLPKAQRELGVDSRVLLPLYPNVSNNIKEKLKKISRKLYIPLEWRVFPASLWRTDIQGVPVYLLDIEDVPFPAEIYPNLLNMDLIKPFFLLSLAAIEFEKASRWRPQILHLHDWPTSSVAIALKWHMYYSSLSGLYDTVLTIHNLAHQGIMQETDLISWGLPKEVHNIEGLEYYGMTNLLKGGIIASDAVTTVSPRYSWEIQTKEYGMGLDGVLKQYSNKLRGILNGIDYSYWNPKTDPFIPAHYDVEDIAPKRKCREELLSRCGWSEDGSPILIYVGRLAEQKGIDLILLSIEPIVGHGCKMIILGEGSEIYERTLKKASLQFPTNLFVKIGYDEELAHLMYAGGDMLIMPSYFEPCGLAQLIAMRYGTVPICRATGGLADTVIDADTACDGTGFLFSSYSSEAFLHAIGRALGAWNSTKLWNQIVQNCMRADFSWSRSSREYVNLYLELLGVPEHEDNVKPNFNA